MTLLFIYKKTTYNTFKFTQLANKQRVKVDGNFNHLLKTEENTINTQNGSIY